MGQTRGRLRLLITGVVALATAICVLATVAVQGVPAPAWWRIGLFCALLAVSRLARLRLRIRGQNVSFDWGEGALLIGLALLPAAWLILATPLCVLAASLLMRTPAVKTLYNSAAATLATAAAASLATAICDVPSTGLSWRLVGALGLAGLVFTAVADLTASAAIALSQAENFFRTLRVGVGIELFTGIGNVGAALCIVAVARFDPWLLATLPMLLVSLQIAYHSRLRGQQERQTWTRLETTTRSFTQLDPAAVAESAIEGILEMFQADRVEVRFRRPNGRQAMYRGGVAPGHRVAVDPKPERRLLRVPLGPAEDGLGTLTLHFCDAVALNRRERHALATLATALAVALANAERYEATRGFAEAKAREAATDALTGLGNRTRLREAGAERLSAAAVCGGGQAMLLIDIAHFKEVNDTLGHDAGDRLLIEVARRITDSVGSDELVVRLGSHEFVVLQGGPADPQETGVLAARLIASLDEPMILDGLHLSTPASIGVSVFPEDAQDIPELLRLADAALRRAKRTAERCVRYEVDHDHSDAERLVVVEQSRAAIRDGGFRLLYQPKIDLDTCQIRGVEALIRWQHPTRGLLSPDNFLPAIEQSPLVHEFTHHVIDMALRDTASWLHADSRRTLAVNLSARNLLDPNLPDDVRGLLIRRGVPPGQLVLEVTETAMLSDLETVDLVLGRLRASGVELSLDDFGTGYSSLAFLSRIPVDEMKIDRSFVSRMLTSKRDDVVVRGTISLARGLGLRVVAEGVETREEHDRLVRLGCQTAQGYYYSRPVPLADVKMLRIGHLAVPKFVARTG